MNDRDEQRVRNWLDTLPYPQSQRARFYLDMPPEMALAQIGIRVEETRDAVTQHVTNHPSANGPFVGTKGLIAIATTVGTAAGAAATALREFWMGAK